VSIDTKQKRQSALLDNSGMLFPDTVVDASDRVALLGLYSGVGVTVGETGTLAVTLDDVTCVASGDIANVTQVGGGDLKGRPRHIIQRRPRTTAALSVTLDDCTLDARGFTVDLVTVRLDEEFIRENFEETAARYLKEQLEEEDQLLAMGVL